MQIKITMKSQLIAIGIKTLKLAILSVGEDME